MHCPPSRAGGKSKIWSTQFLNSPQQHILHDTDAIKMATLPTTSCKAAAASSSPLRARGQNMNMKIMCEAAPSYSNSSRSLTKQREAAQRGREVALSTTPTTYYYSEKARRHRTTMTSIHKAFAAFATTKHAGTECRRGGSGTAASVQPNLLPNLLLLTY